MQQHPYPSHMSRQGPVAAEATANPPHSYSPWTLALLCLGALYFEIMVWVFPGASSSPVYAAALVAYLGVLIVILALDWRHILDLHGNVDWQSLSRAGRLGLIALYLFLTGLIFSMPVLYLAFVVKDIIAERRGRASTRALKIAHLEAELGMLPGAEGQCAQCHRPLQAGATYCEYCGEPVTATPRVCPKCATVSAPDAQFCPNCGTLFTAPGAAPAL